MTSTACFLGLDVSRSGLVLVVLSAAGEVVASLQRSYSANQAATTDPQDWWRAVRTGIKELLRRSGRTSSHIRCIGLTGDSSGVVALGKDGKVLCPTTLGPDPRVAPHVDELVRAVGARNLLNLASGPATDACAATKLLWLRAHHKRAWHDLTYALPPKDFLRFRLCETLVTDACDAAATLLFNPRTRAWSKQLVAHIGINPSVLPSIANGQAISGRVTIDAARETGLVAGTPVVTGAGHVAAAAVAVGALHPGTAMIELGGEGSLFVPTAEPGRDAQNRLVSTCHVLPGVWAAAGQGLAGGAGLNWLMSQVLVGEIAQGRRAKRDPLELLAEMAAEVPPGADGLLFLPPEIHPGGGGFVGLSYQHQRGHLVRAVLESGALALRQILDQLAEQKRCPEHLTVTGPGAGTTLWCQILADALDQTIHTLPSQECNAVGAAMLASAAVGIYKGIDEACATMVATKSTHHPRKAATGVYKALLPTLERYSALTRPLPPAVVAMEAP